MQSEKACSIINLFSDIFLLDVQNQFLSCKNVIQRRKELSQVKQLGIALELKTFSDIHLINTLSRRELLITTIASRRRKRWRKKNRMKFEKQFLQKQTFFLLLLLQSNREGLIDQNVRIQTVRIQNCSNIILFKSKIVQIQNIALECNYWNI